jgi:hypothetical protein
MQTQANAGFVRAEMSTQTETNTIRVIVFKEGDLWVAQCLEYDICAQADDLDMLSTRLLVTIKAELKESLEHNRAPFVGIDQAPKRFHMMWDRRPRSVEVNPAPWLKTPDRPMDLDFAFA